MFLPKPRIELGSLTSKVTILAFFITCTVLHLQMDSDINSRLHSSFFCGRNQPVSNLSSNCCLLRSCPYDAVGRYSAEWHIAICPCPSKMHVCIEDLIFWVLLLHARVTKLVQLRGCLQIVLRQGIWIEMQVYLNVPIWIPEWSLQ